MREQTTVVSLYTNSLSASTLDRNGGTCTFGFTPFLTVCPKGILVDRRNKYYNTCTCIRIRIFLGFLSPEKAAVCLQPPDIVFSNLALNKWMDGESMVDRVA